MSNQNVAVSFQGEEVSMGNNGTSGAGQPRYKSEKITHTIIVDGKPCLAESYITTYVKGTVVEKIKAAPPVAEEPKAVKPTKAAKADDARIKALEAGQAKILEMLAMMVPSKA